MSDIIEKAQRYYQQLPPHAKKRDGGVYIKELLKIVEKQQAVIDNSNELLLIAVTDLKQIDSLQKEKSRLKELVILIHKDLIMRANDDNVIDISNFILDNIRSITEKEGIKELEDDLN